MLTQVHYLIRSKSDGHYLAAHPRTTTEATAAPESTTSYLIIFKEYADALSYLNTHSADLSDRFTVESVPGTQLNSLLQRWGFSGIGLVQDPLIPRIEFLSVSS
ncbi:MAG: hypothetical protein F6K19_32540 [Cyanothece sp. SIO1E1]|nr:hypothetical protein [Cyanothece sp. SIO1E1]